MPLPFPLRGRETVGIMAPFPLFDDERVGTKRLCRVVDGGSVGTNGSYQVFGTIYEHAAATEQLKHVRQLELRRSGSYSKTHVPYRSGCL